MRFPVELAPGYTLVRLHEDHAQALNQATVKNLQRFRLWEAWAHEDHTLAHTAAHVASRLSVNARGDAVSCLIMRGDEVVGSLELRIDANRHGGEIGYWLAQEAVGRGLATQASARLIDHARELGLERVRLRISERNERSLAVAERLGFSRLGSATETMLVGTVLHTMLVFTLELQPNV